MIRRSLTVTIAVTDVPQQLPDVKCAKADLHADDENTTDIFEGDADEQTRTMEPGDNRDGVSVSNLKEIWIKGDAGEELIVHYYQ